MNISNYGAPQLEVLSVQIPQGHTPTWRHILPQTTPNGMRLRLTAINKREFTIYSMQHGCSPLNFTCANFRNAIFSSGLRGTTSPPII